MTAQLFTPFQIRGTHLKNRIVASPMWQYEGLEGRPTDVHVVQLGRLAEGGAGLVFQEGTTVDRRGRGTTGDLGIWDDDMVPHYARLTELVRRAGAVPGIQLIHAGRKGRRAAPWGDVDSVPSPSESWPILAPSAVPMAVEGSAVPSEMTPADIAQTIQSWIAAARRSHDAGYAVLELQAAHGYLIHTFLSALSNQRTDAYGGSVQNRRRLLLDIVDGVRTVWPDHKPLFVRLSTVDVEWDIEQTVDLVEVLKEHGVDVIDCSSGGLTGVPAADAPEIGYGYQVPFAGLIRARTGVSTMAVGHIVHAHQAEAIIAQGQADLVALGRELLHHPNWPIDAARRLGVPDPYGQGPLRIAHWLGKRENSFADFAPSTDGPRP